MNRILQGAILPLVKQAVFKNGGNQCRQLTFNFNRTLGIRSFATTAPFKNNDKDVIEQYLKEHGITVKGCDSPPILSFEDCSLPKDILSHVLSQFDKPTPIQAQALPIALEGRNMVGIGQTGSGKTLAFLLPALAHIQKVRETRENDGTGNNYGGPLALILSPTRELALQIQEVAFMYKNASRVRNVCCIGGDSRFRQLKSYDMKPELMIATPGRLNDFLQSREMSISDVEYVVLDEADRMLDMGFEPQIRGILQKTKTEKQVLMFSATWPKEVKELAEDFLGKYTFMNIGSMELRANKNIKQEIIVCEEAEKHNLFVEKVQELRDSKILIFAEKKVTVDRLERMMRQSGIRAMGIHGDKSQSDRSRVIRGFKRGDCNIMIATDVAARGLDISNVEYVINYDFPSDIENYVHRIGRTGRSDKKGTSITFVSEEDASLAGKLIKILKEGDQEIPEKLVDLSRSSSNNRSQKQRYGSSSGGRRNYNSGYQSDRNQDYQSSRNRDYQSDRNQDYQSSRNRDYQSSRNRDYQSDRNDRNSYNRPSRQDDSENFH